MVHPGESVVTCLSTPSSEVSTPSSLHASIYTSGSSSSTSFSLLQPTQRSLPYELKNHTQSTHLVESEKLRTLRQRKERRELKRERNVYKTVENSLYNIEAILESFGEETSKDKKMNKGKSRRSLRNGSSEPRRSNGCEDERGKSERVNIVSDGVDNADNNHVDNNDVEEISEEGEESIVTDKVLTASETSVTSQEEEEEDVVSYTSDKRYSGTTTPSSDSLFTKVTSKKAKWKKKSFQSNCQQQIQLTQQQQQIQPPDSNGYNGYNLRSRDVNNEGNSTTSLLDFPPLNTTDVSFNRNKESFSPGTDTGSPVSRIMNMTNNNHNSKYSNNTNICTYTSVKVALTEEEYNEVGDDAPVVILGRGKDWSPSSVLEFGFELNQELLAMAPAAESSSLSPSPHCSPSSRPLDSEDNAILSFGDLLIDKVTSPESGISSSLTSPGAAPTFESVSYNYAEIINFVSSSWMQIEKDISSGNVSYYPATVH